MKKIKTHIRKFWSVTSFENEDLSQYASKIMLKETRTGVMSLSALLLGMIVCALPVYAQLELQRVYLYTYFMIAVLCVHIFLSARKMEDINVLYMLGITLLIISATAFVSIAHQTSSFSVLLFANVVLLFITVPMVPWGVREASFVVFIIYMLLSLSTRGMSEKFGVDTVVVLQFLMIAAAVTSMVQVARGISIRKQDLIHRFLLEQKRKHLMRLSNVDPLTGAGNRRFEPLALKLLTERFPGESRTFDYALLDINDFKILNDTYGHDFGDKVLQIIGETFIDKLADFGFLVRLGGDEFSILLVHDDPDAVLSEICNVIESACASINPEANVYLSYGRISADLSSAAPLDKLYLDADKAMYDWKEKVKSNVVEFQAPAKPTTLFNGQ